MMSLMVNCRREVEASIGLQHRRFVAFTLYGHVLSQWWNNTQSLAWPCGKDLKPAIEFLRTFGPAGKSSRPGDWLECPQTLSCTNRSGTANHPALHAEDRQLPMKTDLTHS